MRYLCLDIGEKRTGLAIGDPITGLVTPLDVIDVSTQHEDGQVWLREITRRIHDHIGVRDALVVGLPFNMDGTEGPQAKRVRELATKLGGRSGHPVHFQDERLTSAAADWEMAGSGMTRGEKKQRRDALAAAAILRDFLSSISPAPPSPPD
ncbi:MAG: Holliday junction resolvase RuvX [Phycisphaeraceae bacterium]|nr:Holliday junction resolvase RuvX [Phycisphaeraceae bacterium]MCW5769087.1 Holliday junction resolvase RuvX [Phycisphaeraceae bacterium]